ncbi:MAG: tetratricopeptide repeat protein [Candidatus Theseobacter exili]|nr:tetratricopeptide repeat protein [Candidatus Theseobacter exili]
MDKRIVIVSLFFSVIIILPKFSLCDDIHDEWIKRRHNAYNIGDKDRERRALGLYYYELSEQQKPFRTYSPMETNQKKVSKPPEPDYTSLFSSKSPGTSSTTMALNLVIQGYLLFSKGKYKEALSMFRSASRMDSDNYEVCLAYGCGLFAAGDYFESALWFRKGLELHPDRARIKFAVSEYFPSPESYEAAYKGLNEWTQNYPKDEEELFLLGLILFLNEKKQDASLIFKRLNISNDPIILELLEIADKHR